MKTTRSEGPDARVERSEGPAGDAAGAEAGASSMGSALLQRKVLRRKAQRGGEAGEGAERAVAAAPTSGGAPLPAPQRQKFESSLGTDLGGVRVHTGKASEQSSKAVGARAYTVGQDIHFAPGEYRPSTPEGDLLLAHETAHTAQGQGGGKAQYKLEVSAPGDHHEIEADRAADAMVRGAPASVGGAPRAINAKLHGQEQKKSVATAQHDRDRAHVNAAVEDGLNPQKHQDDKRLKNSCEWLKAARSKVYALTPRADSDEYLAAHFENPNTSSYTAYFESNAPLYAGNNFVAQPGTYYADDLKEQQGTIVYPEGTEGSLDAAGGRLEIVNPSAHSIAALQSTFKHEVQHGVDGNGPYEKDTTTPRVSSKLADLVAQKVESDLGAQAKDAGVRKAMRAVGFEEKGGKFVCLDLEEMDGKVAMQIREAMDEKISVEDAANAIMGIVHNVAKTKAFTDDGKGRVAGAAMLVSRANAVQQVGLDKYMTELRAHALESNVYSDFTTVEQHKVDGDSMKAAYGTNGKLTNYLGEKVADQRSYNFKKAQWQIFELLYKGTAYGIIKEAWDYDDQLNSPGARSFQEQVVAFNKPSSINPDNSLRVDEFFKAVKASRLTQEMNLAEHKDALPIRTAVGNLKAEERAEILASAPMLDVMTKKFAPGVVVKLQALLRGEAAAEAKDQKSLDGKSLEGKDDKKEKTKEAPKQLADVEKTKINS